MSVTFTWENEEQTQLRFIFDVMWQLDDLARVVYFSQQLIEDRGEVVDIIIDMSKCESMPSNLSLLRDHLRKLSSEYVGVMVFITNNIYMEKVMQLLNQLMHRYFTMYFAESLDEAHRIAQRATNTRQNQFTP